MCNKNFAVAGLARHAILFLTECWMSRHVQADMRGWKTSAWANSSQLKHAREYIQEKWWLQYIPWQFQRSLRLWLSTGHTQTASHSEVWSVWLCHTLPLLTSQAHNPPPRQHIAGTGPCSLLEVPVNTNSLSWILHDYSSRWSWGNVAHYEAQWSLKQQGRKGSAIGGRSTLSASILRDSDNSWSHGVRKEGVPMPGSWNPQPLFSWPENQLDQISIFPKFHRKRSTTNPYFFPLFYSSPYRALYETVWEGVLTGWGRSHTPARACLKRSRARSSLVPLYLSTNWVR